jgi:hypothetical protein
MANWTTVDWIILGVAAFVAVTSLVRLMVQRRDSLVRDLDEQAKRAKEISSNDKPPPRKTTKDQASMTKS